MAQPEADVERIYREIGIGEQPAPRRTKDIMTETTTTSDSDVFPPDRPVSIVPKLEVLKPEPKPIFATPYVWKDPATLRRREWLYGYLLIRKFVTATVAPGGVGKSSLGAVESLAQVSGKNSAGGIPAATIAGLAVEPGRPAGRDRAQDTSRGDAL